MNDKNTDKLIGSLWVKTVGEKVIITGVVNGKRVKLVKNTKKDDDKKPSYFVFEFGGQDDDKIDF